MTISYTSMFIYYEVHDLRQCEFVPLASTYSYVSAVASAAAATCGQWRHCVDTFNRVPQ